MKTINHYFFSFVFLTIFFEVQAQNAYDLTLKNVEALNISVSSEVKKYYSEIDCIDGWFDKRVITILCLINEFQTKNGIIGNVGEIGVWRGKSLIPLIFLLKKDEFCAAIDCFEQEQFNRDNSGGLNHAEPFLNNIKKYCSAPDKVKMIKGDSFTFLPSDYLQAMGNGMTY